MLTAVIADDEALARRRIRALLRPHADIEIVRECRDGASTITAINQTHPSLLFLDVEMPEVDGFGVLAAVGTVPAVIFVTAHQQYAVEAFSVHALDYLLKPFRRSRFQEALIRARTRIRELEVSQRYPSATFHHHILAIRTDGRTVLLNSSEVECITAERDYVHVVARARDYLVREGLSHILARLDERFLRVHKSVAVNLMDIREVQALRSGDARLTLSSGRQVTLSRTHRADLDEAVSRIQKLKVAVLTEER